MHVTLYKKATNDTNAYCILLHPRIFIKTINYDFPRVRLP